MLGEDDWRLQDRYRGESDGCYGRRWKWWFLAKPAITRARKVVFSYPAIIFPADSNILLPAFDSSSGIIIMSSSVALFNLTRLFFETASQNEAGNCNQTYHAVTPPMRYGKCLNGNISGVTGHRITYCHHSNAYDSG